MEGDVHFVVRVYGTPSTRPYTDVFVLTTDKWDDFGALDLANKY